MMPVGAVESACAHVRACACRGLCVRVFGGGGEGQNVREVLVDAMRARSSRAHVVAAYGDGRCGSRASPRAVEQIDS